MKYIRTDLQEKIDELNAEIQQRIEEFVRENNLQPAELIVEIDDFYPYGQFYTPTKYGLFAQQNKGCYRTTKLALAPGKLYVSDEILEIYRRSVGRETTLSF